MINAEIVKEQQKIVPHAIAKHIYIKVRALKNVLLVSFKVFQKEFV